jgi:hypothetical protein
MNIFTIIGVVVVVILVAAYFGVRNLRSGNRHGAA